MRLALLLLTCGLGACAPFPQIASDRDNAAPFPRLVPLAPILAQAAAPGQVTPASIDMSAARVARLQARAAALRGPVVDPATRARMDSSDGEPLR